MRQWLRKHRRLLKWSFIIAAALWLFNFLFLGISIDDFFIKGRLESAKANWETSGIKSYRMVIDVGIPLVTFGTRISMIVKDGVVDQAEQKSLFDFNNINYNPDEVPFEPIDPEKVSRYTMQSLFDRASDYIDHRIGRVTLDFSPAPVSYLLLFSENCSSVPPLFGPAVGDCGFSYKIQEFEPLAD